MSTEAARRLPPLYSSLAAAAHLGLPVRGARDGCVEVPAGGAACAPAGLRSHLLLSWMDAGLGPSTARLARPAGAAGAARPDGSVSGRRCCPAGRSSAWPS